MSSYPIRGDFSRLTNQVVEDYVTQLIKDLKKVPINSSNMSDVKTHLLKLGAQSERVRILITEKLPKLSCDKSFIYDLQFSLVLVYTKGI